MTLPVRLPETLVEFPPALSRPQVTIERSLFRAAKAKLFEYTAVTLEERLAATAVEFPPLRAMPQVKTEPLLVMAAKALEFGDS